MSNIGENKKRGDKLHVNEVEISQVSILYADIIMTETIFTLI